MALPLAPNVTFDVFHNAGGPGGVPDVAGAVGYLSPIGNVTTLVNGLYTHILLVDLSVDVRDLFGGSPTNADNVYIPDKTGTQFSIYLVERVNKGTRSDHKRCFLLRKQPTWPTNNL
jgi:hypothetical protein